MSTISIVFKLANFRSCCKFVTCLNNNSICSNVIWQKKFVSRSIFTKVLWHSEEREILVPVDVMYNVVIDVDKYKDFIPWCTKSKVICKSKKTAKAKLAIGFGPIQEHYKSTIIFNEPNYIKAICTDGLLFHMLDCTWKFSEGSLPSSTNVEFDVCFEFRSLVYSNLAQAFFDEIVKEMVAAFETRAQQKFLHLK